jgi:hypothetical protein
MGKNIQNFEIKKNEKKKTLALCACLGFIVGLKFMKTS